MSTCPQAYADVLGEASEDGVTEGEDDSGAVEGVDVVGVEGVEALLARLEAAASATRLRSSSRVCCTTSYCQVPLLSLKGLDVSSRVE